MANPLKSYVEKYLLNPASTFNVDEEGEQVTRAKVVDAVAKEERADHSSQSVSKLRARNAALLSENDPRYKGKKVSRQDLKKGLEDITYDPSLSKFFAVEDDADDEEEESEKEEEEEEEGDEDEEEVEDDGDEEEDEDEEYEEKDEMESDNEEAEEDDTKEKMKRLSLLNKSDDFTFDSDVSKYFEYEDFEDEDSDDDDDDEDDNEEEEEDGTYDDEGIDDDDGEDLEESGDGDDAEQKAKIKKTIQTFSTKDQSEDIRKGHAVKSQLKIYDSLFEGRIGMQKVLSETNQLPQHDTFKLFLAEDNPLYNKNLSKAKSAAKGLLKVLMETQELLLAQNPETKHILGGKKQDRGSDEEITSSEDEDNAKEKVKKTRGIKRKLKTDECEELLSKRFAASIPFRDQTINTWYEKTKLLFGRNAQYKFSGFEVSALQQLKNILSNKEQLIRRTQMTGGTRGTVYNILGRNYTDSKVENEEYDPEIFDDTDFYSRMLEEMLKSKVGISDDMIDVSRKLIEIQNLRKKAKKTVDTKATKGRKIRYQVMSKLVQYLAPSHPPQMDDAAMNILFASLFGNSLKNKNVESAEDTKTENTASEQRKTGINLPDL